MWYLWRAEGATRVLPRWQVQLRVAAPPQGLQDLFQSQETAEEEEDQAMRRHKPMDTVLTPEQAEELRLVLAKMGEYLIEICRDYNLSYITAFAIYSHSDIIEDYEYDDSGYRAYLNLRSEHPNYNHTNTYVWEIDGEIDYLGKHSKGGDENGA